MTEFKEKLNVAKKQLAGHDARLAGVIEEVGDCTLAPHSDYYRELVDSIVSQQLSVKAANTIMGRFFELYGGEMPKPKQIIDTDTETLRKIGCSYAKASYIKDLAERILDGRLDLAHIATMPNELVIEQLVAVKGIGEWTSHMFMIFSLGRLDILATGDLGIRKAAMQLYNFPNLPTPQELKEIAEKNSWHPYESVACWYLWKTLK